MELDLASKRKPKVFSNCVQGNTFSKFEFIVLIVGKSIFHNQYLLERYPKLGDQSRITDAVATTFIFVRFMKDALGVTNFL